MGTVHMDVGAARAVRARGGRPEALPMAGQEGRNFLLISCLIRIIHMSSPCIERFT
jgi:hypothetical protein